MSSARSDGRAGSAGRPGRAQTEGQECLQSRRRSNARNIPSVPCRCGQSCTVGPPPKDSMMIVSGSLVG